MKKQLIYRIFILGAVPLLLASCFAAKEYERPQELIDETYYRTDAIEQDSINMAVVSWRELFSDPI
ncbi:MAG TPA: hypothetical protein DG752_12815, partial [Leeuwenhoekiella sp.]|nr:hypothetical protein [Leeuwenhoekiella sp.]